MAIGPGKYDDICEMVQKKTEAEGVLVIIFGGNKGNGFSCITNAGTLAMIPEILESTARQIRRDREGAMQ